MRLLLDTHTYLWAINEAERLPSRVLAALGDPANELHMSVASLWEATIKIASGKLRVPKQNVDFLLQRLAPTGVEALQILPAHLRELQKIEWEHRDPFDRMLVAQARAERMKLVTVDDEILRFFEGCL